MPNKKMGFEGKIYYDAAGGSATQEWGNTRDITEDFGTSTGDTSERGTAGEPIIEYARVGTRTYSIKVNCTEDSSDTILTAIKTAAAAGEPVAIKTKSDATGKGIDGDMIVESISHGKPYKTEQTLDITFKPNNDNRAFQFDVP